MKRSPREIRRDIRVNYENAGIGRQMNDRSVVEHFLREARAVERELELVRTGCVLTR